MSMNIMNSSAVFEILQKIEDNKGSILSVSNDEKYIINNLVSLQYLGLKDSVDTDPTAVLKLRESYEQLKLKMTQLRAQNDFSKKNSVSRTEYDSLMKEESKMRSEIINKSENNTLFQSAVNVDGFYYYLTYQGRELLTNLLIRKYSLTKLSLEDFFAQLKEIDTYFDTVTTKADNLFKIFQQQTLQLDEIYLNSLVFSLALLQGDLRTIVNAYENIFYKISNKQINPDFIPFITEIILINTTTLNEQYFTLNVERFYQINKRATTEISNIDQVITISALFLPLITNDFSILPEFLHNSMEGIEKFHFVTTDFSKSLVPFILLATFHGDLDQDLFDRYNKIYNSINGSSDYNENSAITTALFFISERDFDDLFDRYLEIKNYLSRFGEDGMMVSALLLAQIPFSIPEILDILRRASNKISQKFKGMSGLENMNLAIKMFLQSAYNPNFINKSINMLDNEPITEIAPIARTMTPFITGGAVSAVRPRGYGFGFATAMYFGTNFHSTRRYYRSYSFHPMHSHFMQG